MHVYMATASKSNMTMSQKLEVGGRNSRSRRKPSSVKHTDTVSKRTEKLMMR